LPALMARLKVLTGKSMILSFSPFYRFYFYRFYRFSVSGPGRMSSGV
jgi:hypothetical protein